jgi:hypothetical protein
MGVIEDVDRNEPKGQGGIGAIFWQDGMLVSERTKRQSSEVEKTHPYKGKKDGKDVSRRPRKGAHISIGG